MVPTKIKSKAYSFFVTINWTCNLMVSLFTLSAIDALGKLGSPSGTAYSKQVSD